MFTALLHQGVKLCVSVCAGIVLPVCIRGRALYLGLSVIF